MTPRDGRRVHLLTRQFDLTGLAALRREVAHCAEQNGLTQPALYRFVVAVNEITTNAVRHGGGGGQLDLWRRGDQLVCWVSDHGPGMPRLQHLPRPPTHALSGRGLWLAQQSCEVSAESNAGGTVVTLVCRTPTGPQPVQEAASTGELSRPQLDQADTNLDRW